MKTNTICSFIFIFLAVIIASPGQASEQTKIVVMNPRGIQPEIRKIPMAPRPASWFKKGMDAVVHVSRFKVNERDNSDIMASKNDDKPATTIEVIVAGGSTNTFWSGGDFGYVGSASVDHWR